MYRRCAPSAAETGRASLGVQSSELGRPRLSHTDRTRLARPPITCASCAENACLIRLSAIAEQSQVRAVEVALPPSISSSELLSILCACALPIRPVCGRRRCRRRSLFGGDELEAEPSYGETTVVLRRPRAELERGRVRRRCARSGRRRVWQGRCHGGWFHTRPRRHSRLWCRPCSG